MILNMEKMTFEKIIGSSEAMRRQIKLAEKASDVDLPVLITGGNRNRKRALRQGDSFAKLSPREAIYSRKLRCRSEKSGRKYFLRNDERRIYAGRNKAGAFRACGRRNPFTGRTEFDAI